MVRIDCIKTCDWIKAAKELWDKLLFMIERDNQNHLAESLMNVQYKDRTKVNDNINEIQGILTQLFCLNISLDDD